MPNKVEVIWIIQNSHNADSQYCLFSGFSEGVKRNVGWEAGHFIAFWLPETAIEERQQQWGTVITREVTTLLTATGKPHQNLTVLRLQGAFEKTSPPTPDAPAASERRPGLRPAGNKIVILILAAPARG